MAHLDLVILTVLPEEYQAVCQQIPGLQDLPGKKGSPNEYAWKTGSLETSLGGSYSLAVGMLGRPGETSSALAAAEAIRRWKPRYVFFVGVAGGLAGLSKGDVIIADVIYHYEYGKLDKTFLPRSNWTYRTDQALLTGALKYMLAHRWSDANLPTPPAPAAPKVRTAVVGSGNKVIDDPANEFFAAVLKANTRLTAVEMEGAGVAEAIEKNQAGGGATGFMMIRGISDLPRSPAALGEPAGARGTQERDDWKPYAAATAAAFLAGWIKSGLPVSPAAGRRPPSPSKRLLDLLRDPAWQAVGVILALLAVLVGLGAWFYPNILARPEPTSTLTAPMPSLPAPSPTSLAALPSSTPAGTPAGTPTPPRCAYPDGSSDDVALRALIAAEAQALQSKDLDLIDRIFAQGAFIADAASHNFWRDPHQRYDQYFSEIRSGTVERSSIYAVPPGITEANAWFVSANRTRLVRSDGTAEDYINSERSEHWSFGRDAQGCWRIEALVFNAPTYNFPCYCPDTPGDGAFQCLIQSEGEAVVQKNPVLVWSIFSSTAQVIDGKVSSTPARSYYFDNLFPNYNFTQAEHFNITRSPTGSTTYTSGSRGAYTSVPGGVGGKYNDPNPDNVWNFSRSPASCWVINSFAFHQR